VEAGLVCDRQSVLPNGQNGTQVGTSLLGD